MARPDPGRDTSTAADECRACMVARTMGRRCYGPSISSSSTARLEHKGALRRFLRRAPAGIQYTDHLDDDGVEIFAHAGRLGLQVSAMPFPLSSFIAFSFLGRCDNPMPRRTFGALVNWMLS
jgi:hypothetical protein